MTVLSKLPREREAQAEIATAMMEIAEADDVIVEAALHLPDKTRSLVAGIRRTILFILRRLERRTKGWSEGSGKTHRELPKPGDEEKF